MFKPFFIDGESIDSLEEWIAFIRKTPREQQTRLMDNLHVAGKDGECPDFTLRGDGRTLTEWAREHQAIFTLLNEVKLADEHQTL